MFIQGYSFGSMQVQGKKYNEDLKIIDGEVAPAWFRGAGHKVALSDVRDILKASPDVVVFGQGKPGLMKVLPEVWEEFESQGIKVEEMPTSEAVERFNGLYEAGKKVAAGFHLTC